MNIDIYDRIYNREEKEADREQLGLMLQQATQGHWLEQYPPMHMILTGEERIYVCSACTAKYSSVENKRYCPWCGAFMNLQEGQDGAET